jgi:ribonuclease HI
MCLSQTLEAKIDKFQERVLKSILQVPTYASGNATRYILGQPALSTTRRVRRVANLLRIRSMPTNTGLRKIYDSNVWGKRTLLFGKYQQDLNEIISDQRCSSVSREELELAIKNGYNLRTRAILKKVSVQADLSRTAHMLRMNHKELLHFCPSIHHPLWQHTPHAVAAHARWLTGTAGAECDDRRDTNRDESVCRLCSESNDTRIHRLLDCTSAVVVEQRSKLLKAIKSVSGGTASRFENMPREEQFAWLLSCGCSINRNRDPVKNNRIPAPESPFIAGRSVSPIHGKKDPYTNWLSYNDFREIHSEHFYDLQVYTDGSAPEGLAGYGAVVYAPGSWSPMYTVSGEIGETTNNVAELEAVHRVLEWILYDMKKDYARMLQMNIRLFTDSQYSRDILLSTTPSRHHFYLVESIKALAAKLRYDTAAPVSIHWVPSHIEQTVYGKRPIHGNCHADKLAEVARKQCTAKSTDRQTSFQRRKLQSAISHSLATIENVFKRTKDSNSQNGPSPDDFDFDASQEFPSDSFDT